MSFKELSCKLRNFQRRQTERKEPWLQIQGKHRVTPFPYGTLCTPAWIQSPWAVVVHLILSRVYTITCHSPERRGTALLSCPLVNPIKLIPRSHDFLEYGWEMTTEKQSCAAQKSNTRCKKSRSGAKAQARCLFWRGEAAEDSKASGTACKGTPRAGWPGSASQWFRTVCIRKKSHLSHKDIGVIYTASAAVRNSSSWSQTFGNR